MVALQNGGGIRQTAGDVLPAGGVVPGAIFLVNTLDVLPFANAVTVIPGVAPVDLKAAFEHSVSRHPAASGGFLQVAGIAVVYDPAREPGSRVVSLTLEDGTALVSGGVVVAGAPAVTVVTNSYLAGGGDGYSVFEGYPAKLQLPASYEQALRDYLVALGTISADDPRYAGEGERRITFLEEVTPPADESGAPGAGSTGTGLASAGSHGVLLVTALVLAVALAAWGSRARRAR